MLAFVHDRIFWIYFIVTLFLTILSIASLTTSNNPYTGYLTTAWILSVIALLVLVYHASNISNNSQIEFTELLSPEKLATPETYRNPSSVGYYQQASHGTWIIINILFITLLILATLWAAELRNTEESVWRSMSAIFVLLGGILLTGILNGHRIMDNVLFAPFWVAIAFLLLWFGIALYSVLS